MVLRACKGRDNVFFTLSYGGFNLKFCVLIYQNTSDYVAPIVEGSQRYWQI